MISISSINFCIVDRIDTGVDQAKPEVRREGRQTAWFREVGYKCILD